MPQKTNKNSGNWNGEIETRLVFFWRLKTEQSELLFVVLFRLQLRRDHLFTHSRQSRTRLEVSGDERLFGMGFQGDWRWDSWLK